MVEEEFTAYDVDRPRGILSTADRKFLLGETDFSTSAGARRRRQKIRERVTHAMLDFQILEYLVRYIVIHLPVVIGIGVYPRRFVSKGTVGASTRAGSLIYSSSRISSRRFPSGESPSPFSESR
jgi:hypothetical protein